MIGGHQVSDHRIPRSLTRVASIYESGPCSKIKFTACSIVYAGAACSLANSINFGQFIRQYLPEATDGAVQAVINLALPRVGLRDIDDLLAAWGMGD